jgi:hypothetical protein
MRSSVTGWLILPPLGNAAMGSPSIKDREGVVNINLRQGVFTPLVSVGFFVDKKTALN